MDYKYSKQIFFIVIYLILNSQIASAQKQKDGSNVTENDKALYYFIEGKTLELKNDFIEL